jgi:hypothetical protein
MNAFPVNYLSSIAKYYPLLSNDQLDSELSVHISHVNIYLCFLAICEIQLENILMEVQRLGEMVLTTPASTMVLTTPASTTVTPMA